MLRGGPDRVGSITGCPSADREGVWGITRCPEERESGRGALFNAPTGAQAGNGASRNSANGPEGVTGYCGMPQRTRRAAMGHRGMRLGRAGGGGEPRRGSSRLLPMALRLLIALFASLPFYCTAMASTAPHCAFVFALTGETELTAQSMHGPRCHGVVNCGAGQTDNIDLARALWLTPPMPSGPPPNMPMQRHPPTPNLPVPTFKSVPVPTPPNNLPLNPSATQTPVASSSEQSQRQEAGSSSECSIVVGGRGSTETLSPRESFW